MGWIRRRRKLPPSWNVEDLARAAIGEELSPQAVSPVNIPRHAVRRRDVLAESVGIGTLVRIDARWHRIIRVVPPAKRKGSSFEIQDLGYPEVRHVVTWSQITHVEATSGL